MQQYTPVTEEHLATTRLAGTSCAAMAVAGMAFPLSAGCIAFLHSASVITSIQAFVNHNYLFALPVTIDTDYPPTLYVPLSLSLSVLSLSLARVLSLSLSPSLSVAFARARSRSLALVSILVVVMLTCAQQCRHRFQAIDTYRMQRCGCCLFGR